MQRGIKTGRQLYLKKSIPHKTSVTSTKHHQFGENFSSISMMLTFVFMSEMSQQLLDGVVILGTDILVAPQTEFRVQL